MCKIAVFPSIPKGKAHVAHKLARALAPLLTASDNDGFGYMALGKHGLFGERWLDVKKAYGAGKEKPKVVKELVKSYGGALVTMPKHSSDYSKFGTQDSEPLSMALHARKATCHVSLENVHPFVNEALTTGIIHNGVISNSAVLGVPTGGCDSESILSQVDSWGVSENVGLWQRVADNLRGWYAVAAYMQDSTGNWFLDIVRDDTASLVAGYVEELGGLVFCTSEVVLMAACKKAKLTLGDIYEVAPESVVRHDILGKVVDVIPFETESFTSGAAWQQKGMQKYLSSRHEFEEVDSYEYINKSIIEAESRKQ